MKKTVIVTACVLLALLVGGMAQELERRIITITSDGGTQESADLRFGPITYRHPNAEGVVANVSNLNIFAAEAVLRAPEGVLIAQATGQREASFTNGVRVERARLGASGSALVYSEATGLGVMAPAVRVTVLPDDPEDNIVEIEADEVTFDVDTDTSTSRGNVRLTNGNQRAEAEELTFEEGRDLGRLSSSGGQVVATREGDEGTLIITADEIRVLTNEDMLLARGNVTIVDGDITTTGDLMFFDDSRSRAEIVGSPAVSVNAAEGTRVTGGRLEQRTDINAVRVLSTAQIAYDEGDFALTSEQGQ